MPGGFSWGNLVQGGAKQIVALPVPTSSDKETGIVCEMGTEMLR